MNGHKPKPKTPTAVSQAAALLGQKGGLARAKNLSAKRRSELASIAGKGRLKTLTPERRSELARIASHERRGKRATATDAPANPVARRAPKARRAAHRAA